MPWLRLVLVIASALGAADAWACQPTVTTQVARTPAGATIAEGGGILVESRQTPDPTLGVAHPQLRAGGTIVEATWTYLAPNLSLVVPPPGTTGSLELLDGTRVVISTTLGGKQPAHAAPRVKGITGSARRPAMPPRPSPSVAVSNTTIELAEAPPADVLALVVYHESGNGVAWFRPSGTRYTITTGGKACAATFLPTFIGDKLYVAWVDDRGRVSPRSKLVAVRAR